MIKNKLYEFDKKLRNTYPTILGIDEVGRGCVAGPLVVVGLILDPNFNHQSISDSKKIKKIEVRKQLRDLILNNTFYLRIKVYSPSEVDMLNPKQASILGMKLIAHSLKNKYDVVLTDFEKLGLENNIPITKGDDTSFTIACASIVAKSLRDEIMERINQKYPNYQLNQNQGYGTKQHIEAINQFGPIKNVHRYSYKTIKNRLQN